ncbi:MAG: type III pantothenate kinase [Erysipelotrichaceae bacterium]|nr:MAG: type III pantothenate [Erysipelotrichaceae bacterium]TXT19004.1 MAG: type III pantothenate kinase [Erysipelotrichaceae bacterium]
MLLTIDIGNSNIVVVCYDKHQTRTFDQRYETIKEDVLTYYTQWITLELCSIKEELKIERFILSSVVPRVTETFFKLLEELLEIKGQNCSLNTVKNFEVKLTEPSDIGADFIATSYGALAKYDLPCVIADLGSATKLSAISKDFVFEGGVILPGIKISRDALTSFIPHLPQIAIEVPKTVIGKDTIHAMESGLMYGHIDSVIGIAERMAKELGHNCTKIVTGGFSNVVYPYLQEFKFEPFLLNDGLFEIDRRTRQV